MRHREYSDIYNRRGGRYHEAMVRWPEARGREFEALVETAGICGERPLVVDVPSGGGYLMDYLPDDARLISVDPARGFLQSGRHAKDVKVICAPHHAIPLRDASVDYVLSLAGMHHVRDQVAAVREWHRLLKPGGTLVVGDAETDSPTAHFLDDVVGRYNSMGHEGAYLSASFAAALGEAAFHRIRMESRAYTWDFASRAEMLDFCRVLFALDLEPCDGELLGGIEQTIGFVEDGQRCAMQWALLFFRAERAAPGTGET